ncbi:hypothetical protein MBLNU13_g07116t1 [Cladosporium sp. NU13]
MRDRRRTIEACLLEDERVVSLTNVALLGSPQMELDYNALITDKPRYQDMFSKLPGRPLMLALSAATPIYKGRLVTTDTRWKAMCWAGDDRKPSERPHLPPRMGCTPMYLEETLAARQMNDRALKSAEGVKTDLQKHGVPPALATYFAHILGREPIIDTAGVPAPDDASDSAQYSRIDSLNIHMSTWWPHVRLKLPVLSTANDSLPWRVEFRPMEAQPSDMENAALVAALRVLQQTIQHFNMDLKIPISEVEQNMDRANDRNAATDQIFRFAVRSMGEPAPTFDGWASLDVVFNGIGNGDGQTWRGLLPLARDYLAHCNLSSLHSEEQEKIWGALDLLSARASGRLDTPAKWMRSTFKLNIVPSMFVSSSLVLSHLAAFAALASAQDGNQYAASVLSAIENLDTAALASATANLQNSVISALAESTADPSAIVSNVEADISAVLATLDQFTATADPALLSSIEAQASDIGLDFDSLSQLTDVAEAPEETGSASAADAVSTASVDPSASSVIVISGQSSSAAFTTHNDGGSSSSSSASETSEAASTSASSSSTARASTQAESSASGSTTAASASDNLAAAATGLPIAAVGAGLAVLAML